MSQNLYELDQETVSRIKDCKRHGFPICLEESLAVIFKESAGEAVIERVIKRLGLREQYVDSAKQVWEIYDKVLKELAEELGEDVSQVIEYQSVRKMESKSGCIGCPLYQREVCKKSY